MIPTQTLSRHIQMTARKFSHSTGELSDLLSSISLGVKIISQIVATAGFKGLYGYTGRTNVQGERVHLLDEEADEVLVTLLGASGHFGLLVSEERDSVVATEMTHREAKYVVAFDPLDGSSNIGSNIPVGTIFSILKKRDEQRSANISDFMQPGRAIVAAGYSVYGAKTSFVYSCGDGVHGFTLDPSIGEFVLTNSDIKTPEKGKTYSTNEGNTSRWPPEMKEFVNFLKSERPDLGLPYTARYVGSLVADFDRNLKSGGIFLYPTDSRYPNGRLRLLYECMPLAFIQEQAGGKAIAGVRPVLDLVPTDIHERCSFIAGSSTEVGWFENRKWRH